MRKMKRSGSSHIAWLKKKRSIISKLTVVVRDGLSTLIFIILAFFSRIGGYNARSPECSRETRFDMIILQPGSPLCHMPDLSVGRGMQLALLTINQPDGGGGGWCLWWWWWWCWDGEVLAAAGCWPTFHYTHATNFHMCENSWFSILLFSFLTFFPPLYLLCSFSPCLLLFFPCSSVLISFLLPFKSL